MSRRRGIWFLCGLLGCALACPLQRPVIPAEYYDFRADLQALVTDTALVVMEGDREAQDMLENRLTELAVYLTVDALLERMAADEPLRHLAEAVLARTNVLLQSDDLGGRVRKAFAHPDGQRLAVDAILVGLGRALYRVRSESGGVGGPGGE